MQVISNEVGCETNKVLCVHLHPLTALLVNGPCHPGNRECPPITKASPQLPPIKIKMGGWTNSWKSKPFQFIFTKSTRGFYLKLEVELEWNREDFAENFDATGMG